MTETDNDNKTKILLALFGFILFIIFVIGIFYLANTKFDISSAGSVKGTVILALSFVAGLSMIILPCTLPLVFVIIPLSMGKGYKKGLFMALLFGLGLTITITLYGIIIAMVGGILGLDNATRIMFSIAGIAALLFGLSELNLVKFSMPSFMGTPKFIEERKDYTKALFMGLLLGNAGVGCPNPAFYVMLTYIAGTGSIIEGASLGFVHGLGRVTPLIFLSILGILGINATANLVKAREKITNVMGWSLVVIGAFILTVGLFGPWFETNIVHEVWNDAVELLGANLAEIEKEAHLHNSTPLMEFAPWLFSLLIGIVIIFNYFKKKYTKNKEVKNG